MKRAEIKMKRVVPGKAKVSGIRKGAFTDDWQKAEAELRGRLLSEAKPSPSPDVAKTSGVLRAKSSETGVDSGVMQYAKVLAHAVDTFGSRTRANAWLNRPSRIFNNQSPLQVLTQDPAAVEEELVRIDHGMFA